uniref:Uncharacterized protein n=1 Tax=Junco hyemalis TaxID=40217 RepID=A0A8C5JFA9_JUNHY
MLNSGIQALSPGSQPGGSNTALPALFPRERHFRSLELFSGVFLTISRALLLPCGACRARVCGFILFFYFFFFSTRGGVAPLPWQKEEIKRGGKARGAAWRVEGRGKAATPAGPGAAGGGAGRRTSPGRPAGPPAMGRKRCVGGDGSKMAAGCCGVKKQKLSSSPPSGSGGPGGGGGGSHCGGAAAAGGEPGALPPCGGGPAGLSPPASSLLASPGSGGPGCRKMVVSAEMCCFCFDVLYCHLYGYQPPRSPRFTNDP